MAPHLLSALRTHLATRRLVAYPLLFLTIAIPAVVATACMWSRNAPRPTNWQTSNSGGPDFLIYRGANGYRALGPNASNQAEYPVAIIGATVHERMLVVQINEPNPTTLSSASGTFRVTLTSDLGVPWAKECTVRLQKRTVLDPGGEVAAADLEPAMLTALKDGLRTQNTPQTIRQLRGLQSNDQRFLEPHWPGIKYLTRYYTAKAIPWALAATGALLFFHAARIVHIAQRANRNQCLRCGYSRAGLTPETACPECGCARLVPEFRPPGP
jgi:hypothetical protein